MAWRATIRNAELSIARMASTTTAKISTLPRIHGLYMTFHVCQSPAINRMSGDHQAVDFFLFISDPPAPCVA